MRSNKSVNELYEPLDTNKRRRDDSETKAMKLAILGTRGIPALYGGFETFAEELSTRLMERGMDVTVYCEAGDAESSDLFKGVHLVHIPAPRYGALTTILFDLRCLWHARKAFDVVYMLGYGTSIFCFIPRLWGSTVWINMDGIEWARSKWSWPAQCWFRMMEAAAMWTPNRVIADARGIFLHLQSRHFHLPPVSVIPYGAPVVKTVPDAGLLAEWQLVSGKYYLVVCRLEPENSVTEIVKGFLRSGSCHPLVVVGGIDSAARYVKELLHLKGDRVHFIGSVYDKAKLQALRYHALAYLHGHTVGGTNPSLLEALGCGNIIIAKDNIFNREVAGESAVYFHQENAIAENVQTVESYQPAQLAWLRARAQERVEYIYSWDFVADSYCMTLPQKKLEYEKRSHARAQVKDILNSGLAKLGTTFQGDNKSKLPD